MVFIHDPAADVFERVMGADGALAALRKLQSEGVVGHVGIASNNPWDNTPYIESGEFEAAVVPDAYSLISRVALDRMFPAAERFGMGVVVATPLERGLLATGTRAQRRRTTSTVSSRPRCSRRSTDRSALRSARHQPVGGGASVCASAPRGKHDDPGVRRPEQAIANAAAMREEIPDAFWVELEPLVRDFRVATPPR